MTTFSGIVRLDDRGRLVLPAALRHRLGLEPGDDLLVSEEADGILHLASRRTAARALIGLAGNSATPDLSAVDELRALRRQEAAGEDAELERPST